MTRMIRRTETDARYVRRTVKLKLTPEERAFIEAAILIGRASDDSVIALKEIACPNCEGTARALSKRGLINVWKNDKQAACFTLSDEAEREVTRCLRTRG